MGARSWRTMPPGSAERSEGTGSTTTGPPSSAGGDWAIAGLAQSASRARAVVSERWGAGMGVSARKGSRDRRHYRPNRSGGGRAIWKVFPEGRESCRWERGGVGYAVQSGGVPEWSKGADCKSVWRKPPVGSNPTATFVGLHTNTPLRSDEFGGVCRFWTRGIAQSPQGEVAKRASRVVRSSKSTSALALRSPALMRSTVWP